MPRILFAALCFVAPSCAAAQEATATLVELNRTLLQQMIVERDATMFQDLALDSFVVVAPGGRIEDRDQAAAGVRAFDATAIAVSDERVVFSDDAAVVVGKLVIDGTMQPLGAVPPMKFMAVFVERDGRWRLLARSLTPCHPVAIERGVC